MLSSYYDDPRYKAAEQEYAKWGSEGIRVATRAQRAVSTRTDSEPTLAHIRNERVAKVKGWLWGLTDRDTIRYSVPSSALTSRVHEIFTLSIEELTGALPLTAQTSKERVYATIEAMKEIVSMIDSAETQRKLVREQIKAEQQEAYNRDGERKNMLEDRAKMVAAICDLADNLGYDLPTAITTAGDDQWLAVLEGLAVLEAPVEDHSFEHNRPEFAEKVSAAVTALGEANYGRAWAALYDISELFPLDPEGKQDGRAPTRSRDTA